MEQKPPQNNEEFKRDLKFYEGDDKIISSIERLAQITTEKTDGIRFKTGMKRFDELIDGLETGELIAMTGKPKSGKTLFAQTLTRNLKKADVNSLWFQYELPDRQFLSRYGEENLPMFYLPQQLKGRDLNWIETRILEAKIKYDVRFVVIDNIHFLIDYEKKVNMTAEIGAIVRRLKEIAITNELVIMVLSHAKRLTDFQTEDENMFRDSSSLPAESDKSWVIRRIQDPITGEYNNYAEVIVVLDRQTGTMRKVVKFKLGVDGFLSEAEHDVDISNIEPKKKKIKNLFN